MLLPRHSCISVSGFPSGIPEDLRSILSLRSVRVIPWASHIVALLVSDSLSSEGRWKVAAALRRGIPVVREAEVVSAFAAAATSGPTDLWVDRYKPTSLGDVIGHKDSIAVLSTWLLSWSPTKEAPRAALLTGPPGIGKTTTAHLVAKACGYEIVELNASDERSASAVRRWFETASSSAHVGRKRVVIMDEVDGMSSGDRGGIGELARVIRSCTFPILCIANDRGNPRMRPLASCCLDIRCSRPPRTLIAKALLKTVCAKEKLSVTADALETLCERNGNDIRSLLNALQFRGAEPQGGKPPSGSEPHQGHKPSSGSELLQCKKDELQRIDAFSATGRLFASSGSLDERAALVYVDMGLVPLMVAEGYVAAAGKGHAGHAGRRDVSTPLLRGGAPADDALDRCVSAGDALGFHDMIDTRIRRTQNWGLLPASIQSVVEAATVAGGPAPFQIFPSWLGKMSKTTKHRRMTREIRQRGGFPSTEAVLDARSLLRARLFRAGLSGEAIVDDLVALGLTRDDMMETLVETVFTGDESAVAGLDTKTKGAVTREWKKRAAAEQGSTTIGSTEDDVVSVVSEDDLDPDL